MAVGDIGSLLDNIEYAGTYYQPYCQWISTTIYALTSWKSGNDGEIRTFSVDQDTGAISYVDGHQFAPSDCASVTHVVHIAGTVYAIFYATYPDYKGRIKTINIAADGTIGAEIATYDFALGSGVSDWCTPKDRPINVTGNIWAYYYRSFTGGKLETISISDDGVTMSSLDASADGNTGNFDLGLFEVASGILAGIRVDTTRGVVVRSWSIDGSGNISSVDSETLDATAASYFLAKGTHIEDSDMCVVASDNTIYSFEIDSSGNIGSTLDSDATKIAAVTTAELVWIGDDVVAIGYHSGNFAVKTFHVDTTTGTISADIDSATFLSGIQAVGGMAYNGADPTTDIWAGGGYDTGLDFWIMTFGMEGNLPPVLTDRIYVWIGDPDDPLQTELTDPDYNTVLAVRVERGRDEELGYAASGICEITCDNFYGDYSPENTGGQYYGELVIGKFVTVFEVYNDTRYNLFAGKIDKIEPHPEPDDKIAYIVAIDGMDDLAGTEIETVLRTNTDSEELIGDILDAAGWDADARSIDSGIDTLQVGWYHAYNALRAIQDLEDSVRGFFFVDPSGNAIWQNRHYRVTGDRLTSQFTYNETMVKIGYQWSKRDVKNWAKVIGYKYIDPYYGLPEEEWIYYAPCNFTGAPFIPAGATITLWGDLKGPRMSSDTLVKGTHWNANTVYDKSGTDVSDDITLTVTYYGQSIKFDIENTGSVDAWMVVPDSPPLGAPENGTLLCYGTIYEEITMTVVKEDATSQSAYGKRTISIDAKFKSNYYDVLSYAEYLISKYKDPLPNPIMIKVNAWDQYPDDTMKIEVLTRALSDRVTVVSSHLGVNQDYYVDKITHEYVLQEGGTVHEVTMYLSRALGQSEGQYWILGETGFSELGETTVLGF